jgi:hypothetical protein
MSRAGFEPAILASERPQTYALDRAAARIDVCNNELTKKLSYRVYIFSTPNATCSLDSYQTGSSEYLVRGWRGEGCLQVPLFQAPNSLKSRILLTYITEVSSVHGHVIRDIYLRCVLSVSSINIASHLRVLQTYFLIRLIQRPPVKFAASNADSSAISIQGQYLR